jgi:hypothetical protein
VNEATTIRPSAWYYWLALPFLVLGMGIFIHTLWHGLAHVTDSLTQVVVPGQIDLALKHGESYTVFYERQSVVDGKIDSSDKSMSGLECNVHSVPEGKVVPVRRSNGSTTYTIGGRSGSSVLEFSVAQDGQYHFSCGYAESSRGPEVVLAVGSGVGAEILKMIFAGLGALFGGGGLAVIIFFTVMFMRERSIMRSRARSINPTGSSSPPPV